MRFVFFTVFFIVAFHVIGQNSGLNEIPLASMSVAGGGDQLASFTDDINQVAANPALLDSANHKQSSITYLNFLSNTNQAGISYAHLIENFGMVTSYLRYLNFGDFKETDESGNEIGKFSGADYEIGLNLAKNFSKTLSYGVTLKQYFTHIYQFSSYGLGLDLGTYFHNRKNLTMALVLNDVGLIVKRWSGTEERILNPNLCFGLSKKFANAPLAIGMQYYHLEKWDLAKNDINTQEITSINRITGEVTRKTFTSDNFFRHINLNVTFQPKPSFGLILGYNFRRRLELANPQRAAMVGLSLGAEVRIKKLTLQYAVSSYHLGGSANMLGVITNINEWNKKRTL